MYEEKSTDFQCIFILCIFSYHFVNQPVRLFQLLEFYYRNICLYFPPNFLSFLLVTSLCKSLLWNYLQLFQQIFKKETTLFLYQVKYFLFIKSSNLFLICTLVNMYFTYFSGNRRFIVENSIIQGPFGLCQLLNLCFYLNSSLKNLARTAIFRYILH